MDLNIRHTFLYRVLRPDENPAEGLKPKSSYSLTSLAEHVAFGSRISSKYISTSSDKQTALRFARMGMQRRGGRKRIVTLDVEKLKNVPGIEIIDLTNPLYLLIHCGSNSRAIRYANDWKEVLLVGTIPTECIIEIEDVS